MELKRTQIRLILKRNSDTQCSDYPDIMETVYLNKVVYLSLEEYFNQLDDADSLWKHPITQEECYFDDEWFESYE